MRSRASEKHKIEEYARSLLNAARGEGRAPLDVQQIRHAVKFSPEVLTVLSQMKEEGEADLLDQVYENVRSLLDSEDKTVTVDVTTAVRMSPSLRKKVREKCESDYQSPIFLVEHVEPSILGGIILEAKGHRRDASVRAQLVKIRQTLASGVVGGDD